MHIRIAMLALISLATTAEVGAVPPLARVGVVIEELGKGSALADAGVRPGDVLTAWEQELSATSLEANKGIITSVLEWNWLDVERAPRATVRLAVERDGATVWVTASPKPWRAHVLPRLREDAKRLYEKGRALVAAGSVQEGISRWREIAGAAKREDDRIVLCWIQRRIGDAWSKAKAVNETGAALLAVSTESFPPLCRADALEDLGDLYQQANELERAGKTYATALKIREAAFGRSLAWAGNQLLQMKNDYLQGRLDDGLTRTRKALSVYQKLVPNNPVIVPALSDLGSILSLKGDYAAAEDCFRQALEIQRNFEPESRRTTTILMNLGNVLLSRGDLGSAETYYEQSVTMRRKLDPQDPELASNLSNLGAVAYARGDVDKAVKLYKEAVALSTATAPGSLNTALFLGNLGNIYFRRSDLDLAQHFYQEALSIRRSLAPESLDVAVSLNNLGEVAQMRGDLALAEREYRQALGLKRKVSPHSLNVARSLNNLGIVAWERKNPAQARKYHLEALAIQEDVAPFSSDVAQSHTQLGILAAAEGNLEQAFRHQTKALEILERISRESEGTPEVLHELGTLHRRAGRPAQAIRFLKRAVDTVEAQATHLGTSQEARASLRARHRDFFSELIDVQLELGLVDEAFRTLESSRARGFLEILAARDLDFAEVPPELATKRRRIAGAYDHVQQKIFDVSAGPGESVPDGILIELRKLRDQLDETDEEIQLSSPRLAALSHPHPLGPRETQNILDPGTALLSFSVGAGHLLVFLVTRDANVRVQILPIGERDLAAAVMQFRGLILESNSGQIGAARQEAITALGERLYSWLIAPIETSIGESRRLLILPDGPLHILPWAALRHHGQYLVEWKPVHTALSATLYAELQNKRNSQGIADGAFTAFGDPYYGQAARTVARSSPSWETEEEEQRGLSLTPLPWTRTEVEKIADLYPEPHLYLGIQATEEQAKSLPQGTRFVHFAAHGRLDERRPLDSAIVLSVPSTSPEGRENGLLQAWEIFEQVRINADLVVLSACESGLGKEMGGEGLIGLTRAFQFAGARSVMASLWKISDRTTAELMVRFYKHLKAGMPKDEALRAAQMELIQGPIRIKNDKGEEEEVDASAPYYWAAFQIYGDWQ